MEFAGMTAVAIAKMEHVSGTSVIRLSTRLTVS